MILAVAIPFLGILAVWGPHVLEIPAGIALVLVVPGGAVVAACGWPASSRGSLERSLWALGLSFVVTILIGLVLNSTSSLDRRSWALTEVLVSVAFLAGRELMDRSYLGTTGPGAVSSGQGELWALRDRLRVKSGGAAFLLMLGSAILVAIAVGLSVSGSTASEGVVSAWLTPDAPGPASSPTRATLGVENTKGTPVTVEVTLRQGAATSTWTARLLPHSDYSRTLLLAGTSSATANVTYVVTGKPVTVALSLVG